MHLQRDQVLATASSLSSNHMVVAIHLLQACIIVSHSLTLRPA